MCLQLNQFCALFVTVLADKNRNKFTLFIFKWLGFARLPTMVALKAKDVFFIFSGSLLFDVFGSRAEIDNITHSRFTSSYRNIRGYIA